MLATLLETFNKIKVSSNTHELSSSSPIDFDTFWGCYLMRLSKINQFDIKTPSTLHYNIVGLDVEMNYAVMMQELYCI